MNDLQRITELIASATRDIEHTKTDLDDLSPEYRELGEAIRVCLEQVREVYHFSSEIADGNLSCPVPARHNYYAGPVKDLFYKIKHLTWQANQVAKGDYSQTVDFMGSFSDSFNLMIQELKAREKLIWEQSEDRVLILERQRKLLIRQMARQLSHYQSYRSYTKSFLDFREQYKEMMGQVFELFNQGKYEDGRLLVAKINDIMGTGVQVQQCFSDHEFVDAALLDIAGFCKSKDIPFRATVHIPMEYSLDAEVTQAYLLNFTALIYVLLEANDAAKQTLSISSGVKSDWLTISINHVSDMASPLSAAPTTSARIECDSYIQQLRELAERSNGILNADTSHDGRTTDVILHLGLAKQTEGTEQQEN